MAYSGVHFEVIGPLNPYFGVISQIDKISRGAPIYFARVAMHFILFTIILQSYTTDEPMSLKRPDPFVFLINIPFLWTSASRSISFLFPFPLVSHLAQIIAT